jgi:hypothetical protein
MYAKRIFAAEGLGTVSSSPVARLDNDLGNISRFLRGHGGQCKLRALFFPVTSAQSRRRSSIAESVSATSPSQRSPGRS